MIFIMYCIACKHNTCDYSSIAALGRRSSMGTDCAGALGNAATAERARAGETPSDVVHAGGQSTSHCR